MADQKRGDSQSDQRDIDPLGVDAALHADEGKAKGMPAAEAARVFAQSSDAGANKGPGPRDQAPQRAAGALTEGAGHMATGAVDATRAVVRGAIGATEEIAGGLVDGVTHVAAEIVHGVHDVGLEVRDGATGLIGAAGAIGGAAVHTVADLLAEVAGGVRHVVSAAMGRDGNGYARHQGTHPGQENASAYAGHRPDDGRDPGGAMRMPEARTPQTASRA